MWKRSFHLLTDYHLAWKTALAAAISWEISKLAGSAHPYLAPLSAILCVQTTVDQSVHFGLQRILGTVIGVYVASLTAPHLDLNGWTLGLSLLVIGVAVQALKLEKTVLNQIALSILLVFYFQKQFPSYDSDRIRDTLFGCAAALILNLLVLPPDSYRKAVDQWTGYTARLAEIYEAAASWLTDGADYQRGMHIQMEARSLDQQLGSVLAALQQAEKSLNYVPFSGKKQKHLAYCQEQTLHLRQGYMHLTGMLRNLLGWTSSNRMTSKDREHWGSILASLALYIEEWQTKVNMQKEGKHAYFLHTTDASALMRELEKQYPADIRPNAAFPLILSRDAAQLLEDFR